MPHIWVCRRHFDRSTSLFNYLKLIFSDAILFVSPRARAFLAPRNTPDREVRTNSRKEKAKTFSQIHGIAIAVDESTDPFNRRALTSWRQKDYADGKKTK
jgi:hypothetical protein